MNQQIPGSLLLDPKVIDDPYPFYRQLQQQAPVWRVPGTEVFAVSSFAALADAAGRVEDFSSNMLCLLYRDASGLPGRLLFGAAAMQTLATADPPDHTLQKRTVFPEFVARRMALLEPEIAELAAGCVERALEIRHVDFMAEIGNLVPITMISRLIGFRDSDLGRLLQAAFESTDILAATQPRERLIELVSRSNDVAAWWRAARDGDAPERAQRRHPRLDRQRREIRRARRPCGHRDPAHLAERRRRVDDQPARQRRAPAGGAPRSAAAAARAARTRAGLRRRSAAPGRSTRARPPRGSTACRSGVTSACR